MSGHSNHNPTNSIWPSVGYDAALKQRLRGQFGNRRAHRFTVLYACHEAISESGFTEEQREILHTLVSLMEQDA